MKRIGRSVGRGSANAIARQVLQHKRVKGAVLKVVGQQIRKEMMVMCKQKTASVLRDLSSEAMQSFTWDTLVEELKTKAPTLLQMIRECVRTKRRQVSARSYIVDENAIIGLCTAILLRHRNKNMNLVQRIISVLLYSGHAPKQVLLHVYI